VDVVLELPLPDGERALHDRPGELLTTVDGDEPDPEPPLALADGDDATVLLVDGAVMWSTTASPSGASPIRDPSLW
jgi:hypothetical protein